MPQNVCRAEVTEAGDSFAGGRSQCAVPSTAAECISSFVISTPFMNGFVGQAGIVITD